MKLEPQPANAKVTLQALAHRNRSCQSVTCTKSRRSRLIFKYLNSKIGNSLPFFSFSGNIFCESVFGFRICFRNLFCNETTFHHYISRTAEQKQHQPMLAPDATKPFIVLFVRVRHRDERSCHLQFRVFWTRGHFRTASTPNFRLPTTRHLFGKHRPKRNNWSQICLKTKVRVLVSISSKFQSWSKQPLPYPCS